jgi:biopolymer transport protein ExbB/biopolymer transport protein TolQ
MLLRTVSIIGLLSFSTLAYAQDPAVDPAKVQTPPAAAEDAASTTEGATVDPTEGSPTATEDTPEKTAEAGTDSDAAATEATTAQEPVKQEPVEPEPVAQEPAEVEDNGHSGGHSSQFTVEEMWSQSSGPVRSVLGTLLFMLVAAMGVGLERLITLGIARSQSRKLAAEVGALLNDGKMKEALNVCAREDMSKSYLGHLLSAGLKEFESREDEYGIDAVERAIEKNAITETAALNKGLNILATVGSTAPFVGLVGTIFGIINAFGQIGAEGGADLTTLAPAIGEALITTAFGIIVAIVGVWLFNYFTAVIGSIINDMAESSQELIDWCHKRIRPAIKSAK